MNAIDNGKTILTKTEESLRKLVAQAASSGEYDAVVMLTSWAKTLNEMANGGKTKSSTSDVKSNSFGKGRSTRKNQSAKGRAKTKYPKFFRDADSIIKVAWSKSSKAEYEHKAHCRVIHQLAAVLIRVSSQNPLISMDQVLPLQDSDGEDIPSYQSYLCMAWLREQGLVRQHGRQGYSIKPECDLEREVVTAWEVLSFRNKTK